MNRRQWLVGLGALAMARSGSAHDTVGLVEPPLPSPRFTVTDHQGARRDLREALSGHVTVLQTMFVGCRSICPIQGALFAQVQDAMSRERLAAGRSVQLVSISVDALGDTPTALAAWLATHRAESRWWAAIPAPGDVTNLQRFLDGQRPGQRGVDDHSDQIHVFDEQARLRWRSAPLPSPSDVVRAVRRFAA